MSLGIIKYREDKTAREIPGERVGSSDMFPVKRCSTHSHFLFAHINSRFVYVTVVLGLLRCHVYLQYNFTILQMDAQTWKLRVLCT